MPATCLRYRTLLPTVCTHSAGDGYCVEPHFDAVRESARALSSAFKSSVVKQLIPLLHRRMRHAAQAWRQVAYLAPKACRMSSRSESPRISAAQRGAFILFEGGDRCGKTTQSQSLVDHLQASGASVHGNA